MKTFIRPLDNPQAKLLYLMGATWHNQCMFDIETSEPSFAQLLNSKNIETYTFDIAGSGPKKKQEIFGDCHRANIDYAISLIEAHDIDYVLGYSYGALVVNDMLDKLPASVKGIILLDPYAVFKPGNPTMLDNSDKFLVERTKVAQDLVTYGCTVNEEIKNAYLEKLTDDSEDLVTASYPKKQMKSSFERFSSDENIARLCKHNIKAFFTRASNKTVREKFPESKRVFWTDSSHWILLEPKRFDLANAVAEFIKT